MSARIHLASLSTCGSIWLDLHALVFGAICFLSLLMSSTLYQLQAEQWLASVADDLDEATLASIVYITALVLILVVVVKVWRNRGKDQPRKLAKPKVRTREISQDYSVSASTAVRALETTRISYIAPVPEGVREETLPAILRVMDRTSGQR